MTLEQALTILKAGHPSREVDYLLYRAQSSGRFPEKRQVGDPVPDFVPRASHDISDAFAALYRLAPYATDHSLTCANRIYTFTILDCFGQAHLASVAICAGLIGHMIQRLKPKGVAIADVQAFKAAVKKVPETDGYFYNLSTKGAELALELRDRLFLTRESDNDAWCSSISAAGKAPRDFLDELDKIKAAVFAMRGEKP